MHINSFDNSSVEPNAPLSCHATRPPGTAKVPVERLEMQARGNDLRNDATDRGSCD